MHYEKEVTSQVLGRAQSFPDVFLDIVESDASSLGVLNIDVVC